MLFMTSIILCFAFFNILVQIQSVDESPAVEEHDIVVTESAIRNTLNKLFSTLKLKDVTQIPKLQQYSTLHDFFFSITLQDHDNLKEIARLTKVNIDNGSQIFITQLNEVLDKDNKTDKATDAVYINILVQTFLERLDDLKDTYGLKKNVSHFNINKTVIKHLSSNENDFENVTTNNKTNNNYDKILNDTEFWKPSGRRIYLGKRVSIERFPFMASIQFFKKFQCAGSIIKSDLVITSASCLQLAWNNRFYRENPAFLSVMVGSNFYEIGDEVIPIMEVYFHPNYIPKTLKHNLAIIRLLRQVRLGRHESKVKKIDFDKDPWPLPSNTEGITVVGWGARSSTNLIETPWTNRLSYAVLDFYPLPECREVYSKEFVTDRNFCAGFFSKGAGACNHDAGGPGISHGVLMGVISFGSPTCGSVDAPTVFTKLGYYADWIDQIMTMKTLKSKKSTTERPLKITTFHMQHTPITKHSSFKIEPIDAEDTIDLQNIEYKRIPIQETDKLRTDQKRIFKEFLATIFDSDEMKDYLDQTETNKPDDYEIIETTTKCKAKLKSKVRSKPKIKPTSNNQPKMESSSKSKSKPKLKSKSHSKTGSISKSKSSARNKSKPRKTTKEIDFNEEVEETSKYMFTEFMEVEPTEKVVTKSHKKHDRKQTSASDENQKFQEIITRLVNQIKEEDFLKFKAQHLKSSDVEPSPEDLERQKKSARIASKRVDDTKQALLYLFKNRNSKNVNTAQVEAKYNENNEDGDDNGDENENKENGKNGDNNNETGGDGNENENNNKDENKNNEKTESRENENYKNIESNDNENYEKTGSIENENVKALSKENENYSKIQSKENENYENIQSKENENNGNIQSKEKNYGKLESRENENIDAVENNENERFQSKENENKEGGDDDEAGDGNDNEVNEADDTNKNNEKDYNDDQTANNENDEGQSDNEENDTITIPVKSFKSLKTKQNDTQKLLEMLAESDVYELLSGAFEGEH